MTQTQFTQIPGYGSTMGYQYRFGTSRSPWKFPFWGVCIPMNLGIPYNGSGWWLSPTLKNDGVKVSWDFFCYSQYDGKIKFMFQTTNQVTIPLAQFRKSLKNQQGYSDGPESTAKVWVYWYIPMDWWPSPKKSGYTNQLLTYLFIHVYWVFKDCYVLMYSMYFHVYPV